MKTFLIVVAKLSFVAAVEGLLIFLVRRSDSAPPYAATLAHQVDPARAWTLRSAGAFLVAVLALLIADLQLDGSSVAIQFAGAEDRLETLVESVGPSALRWHLFWDLLFLLFLVVSLVAFTRVMLTQSSPGTRPPGKWQCRRQGTHSLSPWVWVVAAVPLASDVVEGVLLFFVSTGKYWLAPSVQVVASVKWLGYGVLVLAVASAFTRRIRSPEWRPEDLECVASPATRRGGVGIACSGGGIRSAAFSLGGLHGLGLEKVQGANYLTGVSGGAYIAAAMTNVVRRVAESHRPLERLPFFHRSPELETLRARSSYLFLSGGDGRIGLFRAFASIAFNLVVLWLVVVAVGRPLGWLLTTEGLHPELRARAPIVRSVALKDDVRTHSVAVDTGELRPGDNLDIRDGGAVDCPDSNDAGQRFLLRLPSLDRPDVVTVKLAETTSSKEKAEHAISVRQRDGEIRVCATEVVMIAQPMLEVDESQLRKFDSRKGDAAAPPIVEVSRPLELSVVGGGRVVPDAASATGPVSLGDQLKSVLVVDRQPGFTHNTGAAGRQKIVIDGWMWFLSLGALVVALLVVTLVPARTTLGLGKASPFLVGAAVVGGGTIVMPWLLQSLPRLLESLVEALPGFPAVGPGGSGGFLVWVTTLAAAGQAARRLISRRPSRGSGTRKTSLLVAKGLVFALLCVAGVAMAFRVVQLAALNGPNGRLAGLDFFWWSWDWLHLSDRDRWGIVVVLLVVLNFLLPAHRWSLLPMYRDRLAQAFSLGSEPLLADPHTSPAGASVTPLTTFQQLQACNDRDAKWPELLICAAANLNDVDKGARIPAGRWADSFTFSPEEIGGPTVGYLPTKEYYERVDGSLQKDLNLASVVAVAGAAFSPAMGKFAYGPIGGLFAVLNLRLGLWLPQPRWVGACPRCWKRRPGWPYLLNELFGRYRRIKPFVYTTDGGHWENLGLVELLRRHCTEIYVLSAAGDGITSFSTIGEAIALARELFNIDIQVDLSPLRPAVAPPPESEDGPGYRRLRQLLRRRSGAVVSEPFAPAPAAVGWFTYPASDGLTSDRRRGRILFIEANLVSAVPWDVQSWAESQPLFPDDPTSDQFFNHRQFESYRRLGHFQVEEAQASNEWIAAGEWVEGSLDETTLRARLGGTDGPLPTPRIRAEMQVRLGLE